MLLLALTLLVADTTYSFPIAVAAEESLQVAVAGAGEPVVLIPGLFGSAYAYRHVMPLLAAAGYRAIVIEPLGLGSSSRPADADYSLTAQTGRVLAAMDSLHVDQAVLVGHSLGTSVALRVALRQPGRVRAIVSLEGGPGETAATPQFKKWIKFAPIIRLLNGRRLALSLVSSGMKGSSYDGSWVDIDAVLGYSGRFATEFGETLSAYQAMARAEEPEPLRPRLPEIECPVILLLGSFKHDAGPPQDEVLAMQRFLRSFSIDTVPGAGYFVQEEQPAAVAAAVEMMFARSAGVPSR
jgi:pimeloyl-ACP methyl ester carboxylesterase